MKEHVRLTLDEIGLRRAALEHELGELSATEAVLRRIGDEPAEPDKGASPVITPATAEHALAAAREMAQRMSEAAIDIRVPRGEAPRPQSVQPAAPSPKPPDNTRTAGRRLPPIKAGHCFRGVAVRTTRDGRKRFRANFWDGSHNLSLGTFDDELDAAMAFAQALGDPAEIERIQGLIAERDAARGTDGTDGSAGTVEQVPSSPRDRKAKRPHKGPGFKGVKPIKARGRTRYATSYWDASANHSRSCGTYDDELVAALAVARALKDEAEIARIEGLIRERDAAQGTNRTNGTDGAAASGGKRAWDCLRCGRVILAAGRPKKCSNCLTENPDHFQLKK